MYKFEISADSYDELEQKMNDFAESRIKPSSQMNLPKFEEMAGHMDPPDYGVSPMASLAVMRQCIGVDLASPNAEKTVEQEIPQYTPQQLAPPPVSATIPERDNRGMPWDERIHSAARSLNKDGSWRIKRGVEDALVAQVEGQLRVGQVAQGLPPAAMVIPQPPPPTVHVEMPQFAVPQAAQPQVVAAPLAAAAPVQNYENIQTPAGTRPAHTLNTFKNNLMLLFAQLIEEKKISKEYVQQLLAHFELKEVWNFLGSEKKLMELYDAFAEYGFITKVDQ